MESLDTQELTIKLTPKHPWSDVLIAELSELGFDSFVDTKEGIQAYATVSLNTNELLKQTCLNGEHDLEFEVVTKVIPHQNWNAKWEEDFHPVHVEDLATILAPFHDKTKAKGLVVEIQPQMSFGTGHHQTTWMMTKGLFEFEALPENVLDMGTGTGVLAVVAEKLGAKRVLAIDIEEWSAENARENAERNNCKLIECKHGGVDLVDGEEKFGLIIANINKNVLKAQIESYANALEPRGVLMLSGFFSSDVEELVTFSAQFHLTKEKEWSRDEWAGIQLRSSN
ncbi:MAG: 50S ribosomal protein L11 methyltransferase [Crocinitomicaceae bacterium]|nr:50S ribosomal protein L11 methyltransferase [Crocinitomicaceae bacterium]